MGRRQNRLALLACLALLSAPAYAGSFEEHLTVCSGCHGRDGSSIAPEIPRLAALDAEYIARQIGDFKTGKRKNAIMQAMVAALDGQAIEALAAHYSEQVAKPSAATPGPAIERGRKIHHEGIVGSAVPSCSGCHGEDATGDAKYPRLAGQNAAYIQMQLAAFKNGDRTNDARGAMAAVAKRMQDDEMQAVAQYLNSLKQD
jgi:cytochrome c553